MHSASQRPAVKPAVTRLINNVSFPPKHQSKTWYVLASNVFITSYIHRALHLQFFSSLCTIINSIEGPRKHPTNWAPQLLRPALERLVASSSAASLPSLSHFSPRLSLLPLRVTLTHFTLSPYERALRLSTSFPISGLARLEMKPRLCGLFWRAFTSTHPLILPCTSPREALLACPPISPLNLPSFTVESILSSPCSCSSLPLSRSLTLTFSPLTICYSGLTALFLFLLARAAPAYLPTALSVVLRPLFPFQLAQYAQVFPLKPAPFCTLFAGLGSTNKSAISLLFSSYLTLVLSSPPSLLLHLSSYLKLSGRNCLYSPPVLSGYNGSPDNSFSRGTTRLMSWQDGERYLRPLQSLVVCFLCFLVFTLVFSRTGDVPSDRSSSTHRFP